MQHLLHQIKAGQFYLSTVLSPIEKSRIQGLFKAFEWSSSTFQGIFNFQGLFKKALWIQVLFKHVRTLDMMEKLLKATLCLLMTTFVICWQALKTVWIQIRYKTSDLDPHWLTLLAFLKDFFFWKKYLEKKAQNTKSPTLFWDYSRKYTCYMI